MHLLGPGLAYLGLAASGMPGAFSWEEALETRVFKNTLKSSHLWPMLEPQAEQLPESCPQSWWWCPGTWDSFAAHTPPGLAGLGEEWHPTQLGSHPFSLQTSGTVVLSLSWSTSTEGLTWKGLAT